MARSGSNKRLHVDASTRAESALASALDELEAEDNPGAKKVTLDEALHGESVAQIDTGRSKSRVLFITSDATILEPDSRSLKYFTNVAEMFDEVHILVLRTGRLPRHGALRVKHNLWVYVAASKHWWWLPVAAQTVVKDELVFAGGFRPDIIVGHDPYESGATAYWLSRKFKQPVQIHVRENIYVPQFKKARPGNWLRYHLTKFLLNRVKSVRTLTVRMKDELEKRFPNLIDLSLSPQFHDYRSIIDSRPHFDVHEKYHQYSFVMLYLGNLTHQSTLPKVIDSIADVLKNPRVGLVVLGYGPAKSEFENKVKKLGIERQVVFVPSVQDRISYLKTASLTFVTDVSPDGDDLVLDAAASGAPLIITNNSLREDVFEDGVSAMICPPGDVACLRSKFDSLLNEVELRKSIGHAAQQAVMRRVHEDPELFKQAVRDSIETVITVAYEVTDNNTSS